MKSLANAALVVSVGVFSACSWIPFVSRPVPRTTTEWPSYGNDPGGMRYAKLTQINKSNVGGLRKAWEYEHDDESSGSDRVPSSLESEDR